MTDSGAKLARGRVWTADEIVGGHPALDFVNTVSRHLPEVTGDRFRTFDDLLTWGVATGVLTLEE
ncbi:MAG: ABATE domain-containing protein, partial [Gemmatimonadaceae bacterium]|nr:ABATE domain-containing protein [Gemmatimonadaceae bacterium]